MNWKRHVGTQKKRKWDDPEERKSFIQRVKRFKEMDIEEDENFIDLKEDELEEKDSESIPQGK